MNNSLTWIRKQCFIFFMETFFLRFQEHTNPKYKCFTLSKMSHVQKGLSNVTRSLHFTHTFASIMIGRDIAFFILGFDFFWITLHKFTLLQLSMNLLRAWAFVLFHHKMKYLMNVTDKSNGATFDLIKTVQKWNIKIQIDG